MSSEERNFRNQYYDKVGFRGVEEKKSLETILSSGVVDVKKLTAFCLKFTVPVMLRPLVWKVALTVLPPHRVNHDFVDEMRRQQFEQLRGCLRILDLVVDATPRSLLFLKMFLLEEGKLGLRGDDDAVMRMRDQEQLEPFCFISDAMGETFEAEIDAFFASVCFFKTLQDRFHDCFHLLPDCLIKQLRQQDVDDRLYDHLHRAELFRKLPYSRWFRGCFAGIIPSVALEKIWDKVVAGSCMILVHVAVAVLLTHKRPLLTMNLVEDMLAFLDKIPSDSADIVVNKSLETWHKSPLLRPPASREDSPVIIERIPSS